ncbi:MMPL family transporter [Paractinoplanes lichenicola]|uniref:MMPL family transporter n=1 Tax=Paractinoplanes lichenicola TaxID=2802976 RepID=A0ABS1VJJ4_9ACTN|nr:MMPL family transporter [Actinoplanes lichenicola]MBL7253621.1 MMPL family transporter [Actinoplanes lichenicola]
MFDAHRFSLPGQPGFETNQVIKERFGSGGDALPVLLVDRRPSAERAGRLVAAVEQALPGASVLSYADEKALRSADGRAAVVVVYPRIVPGPEPYVQALPALGRVAAAHSVTVTGKDALAAEGGGDQGADVLIETAAGALIVLLLVFGSALALLPLLIAAGSILTTLLFVWGLTGLTDISFIVQSCWR